VLEVKTERSEGHRLRIAVQEEGTYEVVSIKDRWCSFAREGVETGKKGQKMLTY
jgi:nucleoporin POM152